MIHVIWLVIFVLAIANCFIYLAINTIKRFFSRAQKSSRVFFIIVVLLPILLMITAGLLAYSAVSIQYPPCAQTHQQIETKWHIRWQDEIQKLLFVVFASPYILLIISIIFRYKSKNDDKIIYKRAKTLLAIIITLTIVFSIITATLNTARSHPIDASRRALISSLRGANEIYFEKYDHYPVITGPNRTERWNTLKNELSEIYNLPDDPCYTKTDDSYFQYDYRSSAEGDHYVALATLQISHTYTFWCVDDTGTSVGIKSLPAIDQFVCSP